MLLDTPVLAQLEGQALPDDPAPAPGPRMRKVGGLISNQLSVEFAALEARLQAECSVCIACGTAPREDGRLRCGPCQVADAKLGRREAKAARSRPQAQVLRAAGSVSWFSRFGS